MKKLHHILSLTAIFLLMGACNNEGPPGPRGNPGFDGIDGLNGEESFVFEYEFSFTGPDYGVLLELPTTFEMLDSDVMLVYFLWEVTDTEVEVWRALPQRFYLSEGILEYNYDFTKFDASIFLDGTVNFNALGADYTDNWIARVVVVPGQFAGRSTIDYSDYNAVKHYFNLSDSRLLDGNYPNRPK